ncbi:hypothetical protein ABBQ38_006290 [Trebouxia sp. C0009 RCD-2024]
MAQSKVVLLASLLLVGTSAQETLSTVETLATQAATNFVYVPSTTVTGAISTGAGSSTSLRTSTYWSALTGMGISQSAFTLAPCALRSPHIHQRASGILYASDGLIHYQYNPRCTNATYTISYGSELPGTQVVTEGLLALPADAVAADLGINASSVALLNLQVPTNRFVGGVAECVARCSNSSNPLSTAGK